MIRNSERLFLRVPEKSDETSAFDYVKEHGDSHLNGCGGLDRYLGNYDAWLDKLAADRTRSMDSTDGHVSASTYFLIRETDGRIVGMTNIRQQLNAYLFHYAGHIGYGIRPTERQQGYGREICRLALEKCRELGLERVLMTCDKTNLASAKVIQKNGGIFENELLDPEDGELRQRYWIDLRG